MSAPIHRLEETGSTQDEIHRLAAGGAPHGTAVVARVQHAGRGTRGRSWASAEGGLWLSVLCRPAKGSAVEVVGVRAGLAVAELLQGLVRPPARVELKWPNDLMVGPAKLGGILAEARWQGDAPAWIALGIGINVANPLPAGVRPPAVRLRDLGAALEPGALAEPVARAAALAGATAEPLAAAELAAFALRDWLRGRRLAAPSPGIAEGISAAGLLRVRHADGRLVEAFGSVSLADAGR
jgi:BirA family biotin operon repressor/biotin-[acetyl-CoA-carboxylase] ligase